MTLAHWSHAFFLERGGRSSRDISRTFQPSSSWRAGPYGHVFRSLYVATFASSVIPNSQPYSQRRRCSLISHSSFGASDVFFAMVASQTCIPVSSLLITYSCQPYVVPSPSSGQRCQPPVDGKPTWWQLTFAPQPTRARFTTPVK